MARPLSSGCLVKFDLFGPQHDRRGTVLAVGVAHGPRLQAATPSGDAAGRKMASPRNSAVSGRLGRDRAPAACRPAQHAVAQHGDLVGEGQRLGLVVRDQDRGDAGRGRRAGDRLAHLLAQAGVERRERLVEQHQPRLPRQRAGQRDALLLAAGKLVRPALAHRRGRARPGPAARAMRRSRRGSPRSMPKPILSATLRCGNSAPSCGTKPMPRRCGRHRGAPSARARRRARSRPASGASKPAIEPQQRRLAGAGGPDDRRAAAGATLEVDAVERRDRAVALAEAARGRESSSPDAPSRLDVEQHAERQRHSDHQQRIGRGGA